MTTRVFFLYNFVANFSHLRFCDSRRRLAAAPDQCPVTPVLSFVAAAADEMELFPAKISHDGSTVSDPETGYFTATWRLFVSLVRFFLCTKPEFRNGR